MGTGSITVSSHFSHQMPESCPLGFLITTKQLPKEGSEQYILSMSLCLREDKCGTKWSPPPRLYTEFKMKRLTEENEAIYFENDNNTN